MSMQRAMPGVFAAGRVLFRLCCLWSRWWWTHHFGWVETAPRPSSLVPNHLGCGSAGKGGPILTPFSFSPSRPRKAFVDATSLVECFVLQMVRFYVFFVMFKLLINTYSVLFYFFIYNTLSINPSIHQWKWGWWMCVALLPVKHPAFKGRQNSWCQKFLRLETKLLRILENGAVEHVFEGCKSEDVFFFQRERGPEKTPPRFIPYGQFSEIVWGIQKNETQSKHIKKLRIQDMTHLEQPTAEANSAQLPQKVGELCKCRVCWKVLKLLLTTWGLIECSWQLGVGWNCDSWILLAQVLRGANSFRHQSEHQLVPILVPRSRPRFYGHDQHRYEGATFKRLVHHRRCNWQPEAFADHRVYRRQDRFGRSAQHRADHPRTTSGMFLAICLSMLHSALGTSILTVVSLRILNAGMSSRYYWGIQITSFVFISVPSTDLVSLDSCKHINPSSILPSTIQSLLMLFRSGAGFIVLAMWLIFANNSKAALRKDFEDLLNIKELLQSSEKF